METQDELQILIDEAKKDLSKETRQAIDSVNWKLTILEMSGKYNQDQLDTLETETELLLCGILSPEVYQTELENRMRLTKEEVSSLIEEMDKLIFKKIQSELEKILARQSIKIPENKIITDEDKIITNYQLLITNKETAVESIKTEKKVTEEDEVPRPPYGINSMQQVESSKDNSSSMQEVASSKEGNATQTTKSDVFENKLKAPSVSPHTVSEYSPKTPDPYREQF